ncbi:HK97 family phage prohead protease [Flavobacterium soyangense]|uniref:Caudovirus prohead protease n=1 Tax=Flavobacterium soyangense TaxID=2023265 RepID=A0A930U8B1_9FLAO|nr:caudovirus prohead protease [Flavobacterium soyangense]MBF2708773.1 caudovirus prohead protease [Flavobacterium soyangense]
MPKPKIFILNDDAVQNSYGFFILTSGGKLDRFKSNPVMLSDHINKNENVIGNWLNLQVENGLIKAEPNFDVARPIGLEISGQVDRDFIKGASMGILPNWDSMERVGDKLILKEWELVEASIVPVPSNRNSIAIYGIDGNLMEESEIQNLCLSVQGANTPNLNPKNSNMKKILLSVATLMALGFDDQPTDGLDVAAVEAKVLGLSSQVTKLTSENEGLKLAAQTAKEAQEAALLLSTTNKVDLAIIQGKIPADKKEAFVKLGIASPEVLETTLDSIPGKQNFGAGVKTATGNGAATVATIEDFQALSTELQLSFKNDNPEEYKKLVESIK